MAAPDSGTTSSGEGGASDASDHDRADVTNPTCPSDQTTGLEPGVACGERQCMAAEACCMTVDSAPWQCAPSAQDCGASATRLDCDSPVDCAPGAQCCFEAELMATTCADGVVRTGYCATSCDPVKKALALCDKDHLCPTGKCDHEVTLVLQRSSRVLRRGLCDVAK